MLVRGIGKKLFADYLKQDSEVMGNLVEKNKKVVILDLGCGDGKYSKYLGKKIGSNRIYGIDSVGEDVKLAWKNGIKCLRGDLNKRLPYKTNFFDVVISHYSIEHLVNIRGFIKESYRVLKEDGYMLVASDNLNSWLNILAMVFSFQPFSLTRGLADVTIGNPFAYWRDIEAQNLSERDKRYVEGSGSHIRVMSTRAAKEVFSYYKFKIDNIRGIGYFPFWGFLSKIFSRLDPYHSHFYILKVVK